MSKQEENFRKWNHDYFNGEYDIENLNNENEIKEYIEHILKEKKQIVDFLTNKISEEVDEIEQEEYMEIITEYYDDDEILQEIIQMEIHEIQKKNKLDN
jgi:biotin-(acetyl-CoA carboxylase) ligase